MDEMKDPITLDFTATQAPAEDAPVGQKALDSELFCLDIGTPDRLSAEMVKKQFILKGNEIYQMLITKLTEEEK